MLQNWLAQIKKHQVEILNINIVINGLLIACLIFNYFDSASHIVDKQTLSGNGSSSLVTQLPSDAKSVAEGDFFVEILGQVQKPGVYLISSKTLIIEAVDKAGGVTSEADMEYLHKNVALSKYIEPNQKIYIPARVETVINSASSQKVNINTATKNQLMELSGIGEVTAQKIIDNRPYSSLVSLLDQNVLSQSLYNKIVTLIEI